jgi:hydroxyacylglutathione hydrolase
MWVDVFDRNDYGTNCWLLAAEGSDEAVVVDPGFEPRSVHALLEAAGKAPTAVLLTHAHVDHAMEAGVFSADDLPVFVHPADALAFSDAVAWGSGFANPLHAVKDLRTMEDGDVLRFGGFEIDVLHTPGHTPGHCIFRIGPAEAFCCSGDLVFAGAIGRSDFPNSSPSGMGASLRRFLTLPDELPVLPGHGATTTVGRERRTNPFLTDPDRWS